MNLVRKLELARAAIASITRHDDASEKEISGAGSILQQYLKDELVAAAARRDERERKALEALTKEPDGNAH